MICYACQVPAKGVRHCPFRSNLGCAWSVIIYSDSWIVPVRKVSHITLEGSTFQNRGDVSCARKHAKDPNDVENEDSQNIPKCSMFQYVSSVCMFLSYIKPKEQCTEGWENSNCNSSKFGTNEICLQRLTRHLLGSKHFSQKPPLATRTKTSVQHWTIPLHKRLITAFRESTQSWNHVNYRYTEADWTKWKSNNSWKHWHCPIPFHFKRYLPSRINSESLSAGGCEATEPKSYNLDHCLHTKTWMSGMRWCLTRWKVGFKGSHDRLRELHLVELEQVHVVGSGKKGTVKSLRT